jgi:hypothetical protein
VSGVISEPFFHFFTIFIQVDRLQKGVCASLSAFGGKTPANIVLKFIATP